MRKTGYALGRWDGSDSGSGGRAPAGADGVAFCSPAFGPPSGQIQDRIRFVASRRSFGSLWVEKQRREDQQTPQTKPPRIVRQHLRCDPAEGRVLVPLLLKVAHLMARLPATQLGTLSHLLLDRVLAARNTTRGTARVSSGTRHVVEMA